MDNSSPILNLSHQAIEAALDFKWNEALKINKKIIKEEPQNIDALNRLAKAYLELGKCNLAKKSYSQVLKIDPYNPIALKNLKIMKSFKTNGQSFVSCNEGRLSPSLFLQEPGKTKLVNLLKVAEPQKLSHVFCGMRAEMLLKNRKISIVDSGSNYLGVLPDDVSHHLQRLIKGGNKYVLFIKSVRVNSLSIIIKEIFRSKRFKNQPSFLECSPSSAPTNILSSINSLNAEDSEDAAEETEA